ncbi:MAG: hypothetical protein HY923_11510 [Elusimicrobia bacterium]|nr:hypothetical protein [Elusimicrobiota bacterium]
MRFAPLVALLCAFSVSVSASASVVEVVPELGNVGSAPAAVGSVAGTVPLQLSAQTLVPALAFPAPTIAPVSAAAAKPVVAEARPLLIKSLAAVPALDVSKLGGGDASGAAEKDFNTRAQMEPSTLRVEGFPVIAAPSAELESGRAPLRPVKPARAPLRRLKTAPAASAEPMTAALAALEAASAGTVQKLAFTPTPAGLKVLSELSYEVFLHRRRSDGAWLMARGDRHGVSGEWDDYDLALHNHPEARMGAYSMHSEYPSPEDLETAAGKNARFFVITKGGVVEWNSHVPKDIAPALTSTFFGRFVMRIAFPALYPTLLADRGVAVAQRSWRKVTSDWLERGSAPVNERVLIEDEIPALVAEEFPLIAAKLGRKVDAAYRADVLARTNGYRMYWHSSWSYKDHPDNIGIPDGHFNPKFGIRLMVKPDWRGLKDRATNFKPLFSHEYVHWLQDEGFVSRKWGSEIAAVAVEVLRAIELVGLDEVRAGQAGTVHAGVMSSFEGGRAWARKGFQDDGSPYLKGSLAGAAYEAGQATGRPEAVWEFLNLVIAGKGALEPADAWARVVRK